MTCSLVVEGLDPYWDTDPVDPSTPRLLYFHGVDRWGA
jgi:hypothetical protein